MGMKGLVPHERDLPDAWEREVHLVRSFLNDVKLDKWIVK